MYNIGIILSNITNRAGTERAVTNLANILNSQGDKIYIFSIASEAGNCPYELNTNVEIVHMNLPFSKSTVYFAIKHYFNIYKKLKEEINNKNIDFVIGTHHFINFTISFLRKRVKTIGCEHFNYESAGNFANLLKKVFYRKLDRVVLLTERDMKNYYFLNNTTTIPNSLSFVPNKLSNCKNKKMVSLGRLTEQKGYDLLIDAVSLIKGKISDWKIEIYGNGEDKEKLLKKIQCEELESVIEIKEPSNDVEAIYSSASIYLSSSRWEGFSLVLLEAQSCGLPCITFDCSSGPGEIIINNITGFVVDFLDIKAFSEKILELVNNENKRIEFGKNATTEAYRYSTENISLRWKNLIENLLESK